MNLKKSFFKILSLLIVISVCVCSCKNDDTTENPGTFNFVVKLSDLTPEPESSQYGFAAYYVDKNENRHYLCQPALDVIESNTYRVPKNAICIAIEVMEFIGTEDPQYFNG